MANKNRPKTPLDIYETQHLDPYHEQLRLWSRPPGLALFAVMTAFERVSRDAQREMLWQIRESTNLMWNSYSNGLSVAVRWFCGRQRPIDAIPTNDEALLAEGLEFLDHCYEYAVLEDLHKAVRRGLLKASVNETTKTVRFEALPHLDAGLTLLGLSERATVAKKKENDNRDKLYQLIEASGDSFRAVKHHTEDGMVVVDEVTDLKRPELAAFSKLTTPQFDYGFPAEQEMCGFTLGTYERVWQALVTWSWFAQISFLRPDISHIASPVQVVRQSEFIQRMLILTDLPPTDLEAVLSWMRYGHELDRPNLWNQPLVWGNEMVAWSPTVVVQGKHIRSLLKLMARSAQWSDTTATLIGSREGAMLRDFGQLLGQYGYDFKLRTDFNDGKPGDIDLLAFNRKHDEEVLVVEGKATLDVDDVNEIHEFTKTLLYARDSQVKRAIDWLKNSPETVKKQVIKFVPWGFVKHYYGLIISPESHPDSSYDHSVVPAISLPSLKANLRANDLRKPSSIWRACKDRKWFQTAHKVSDQYNTIVVGDVRYEVPRAEFASASH